MKFLDFALGGLGLFVLDGLGLLKSYTAESGQKVWLVTENPHSLILTVCDSKRSAYMFRMRYMCEQAQERRNTVLMYGRVGSREDYRETEDNDFWAFHPTVSERVVEVHSPPHRNGKKRGPT